MDNSEPDLSYLERRVLEEMAAAGRCRSEAARRAHEDLARRYPQAALDRSIPMAAGVADERIAGDASADEEPGMMPLSPELRILN